MKLLVTGGCGFIGNNFIRYWLKKYPKDKVADTRRYPPKGGLDPTQTENKLGMKFSTTDQIIEDLLN